MQFEEQDCIECFVKFGVPVGFSARRQSDKKSFYCPNGHSMAYTQSESDRLKAQLQAQQQATRAAEERAAREERWRIQANETSRALERRLAAQKGVTTRMRNRVAAGVCPCCNRSFENLRRHMSTKHKGFVAEEVQAELGQPMH